jgi:NAD(P)-dependent dehydrogenase (short-subunit alcohol dehydrogenase family)
MPLLQDRVCVITGGGGSIGRAMARRFVAEGASVVLGDRDPARLDAAGAEDDRWFTVTADVGRAADAERLIRTTVEKLGRLDVLVNNAAAWDGDGPAAEVSEEDWDAIQTGTLKSTFLCSKYALPVMCAQGAGSIVNIASVNALHGMGFAAYSAAKGGVIALTRAIAAEYGRAGVRVNTLTPGTVRTAAWDAALRENPRCLDEWMDRTLLGRVAEPEEVAALAAFLASDESRNTTAANFVMDAGLSEGRVVAGYRAVSEKERGE